MGATMLPIKQKKSLIDLVFSLLELDPDAEENKAYIQEKLNELEVKVDNYVHFNSFCLSQIDMLKDEKAHVDKEIKRYNRLVQMLKDKALWAMKAQDVKEIKSSSGHRMAIRYSHPVEIHNVSEIPREFITIVQESKIDKMAIKEAIKSGETVAGATILDKENVNFK